MSIQGSANTDTEVELCAASVETVRNGALRNEARQQGQASEGLECHARE